MGILVLVWLNHWFRVLQESGLVFCRSYRLSCSLGPQEHIFLVKVAVELSVLLLLPSLQGGSVWAAVMNTEVNQGTPRAWCWVRPFKAFEVSLVLQHYSSTAEGVGMQRRDWDLTKTRNSLPSFFHNHRDFVWNVPIRKMYQYFCAPAFWEPAFSLPCPQVLE